jgi:hypothetical protein
MQEILTMVNFYFPLMFIDNIDFQVIFKFKAIYLVKRTMRNQEKHALNDFENVNFKFFLIKY